MYHWSESSLRKLETCHPDLIRLFNEVIQTAPFDMKITDGFRGKEEQDEAFANDRSKFKFPYSKHNRYPSRAIDVYPITNGKIELKNREKFMFLRGFVYATANRLGIRLSPTIVWDLPHYGLVKESQNG